jgi:hypothetical protein
MDLRTLQHNYLVKDAEEFTTYCPAAAGRFANYKEKVIDLLKRVTTVRVGTQRIVEAMVAAHH